METRQFIPYPNPPVKGDWKCNSCNIPMGRNAILCDVCWAMLNSLASHYWHRVQVEWYRDREYLRRGHGYQDDR